MLKQGLPLQIMGQTTTKRKKQESYQYIKDELGEKIRKEFLGLRAKTYSYLIDDDENLKFKDYKTCLEATQLENKINHLIKNEIDVDSLREDRLIKNL